MNPEEIKLLLEKYYDGESTSHEEHLLKEFFSSQDVPADMRDEKEIFMHYIHLAQIPEPSAGFEGRIMSAIDQQENASFRFRRRRLFGVLSGIAAAILILAGSYFFFTSRSGLRDTYADPELAYAETMKILYQISGQLNRGTKALGHLSALQTETQKTITAVSKSTSVMGEKLKSLDNVFITIGKANTNNQ